jgi:uncharacterized protein YdbL (DUF1318 family)
MKKMNSNTKAWEVGAGVAAGLAGALVAGYLVYEKTKPHHAKVKAWIASARRDAALQMKKMKTVGAAEYERLVSKAIKHYGAIQKASGPEIMKAIQDARSEWKHIQSEAMKMSKSMPAKRKAVKRKARKATAKKK